MMKKLLAIIFAITFALTTMSTATAIPFSFKKVHIDKVKTVHDNITHAHQQESDNVPLPDDFAPWPEWEHNFPSYAQITQIKPNAMVPNGGPLPPITDVNPIPEPSSLLLLSSGLISLILIKRKKSS